MDRDTVQDTRFDYPFWGRGITTWHALQRSPNRLHFTMRVVRALKLRLWEMAPGTSGKDFQRPHSPHQEMNPLVKKFGSGHIPPSHRYYSSSLTMLEIMAWKEMPPFKSTGESWIHLWGEVQYFNLGWVSCLWRCLLDPSGCWMSVTWRGTTSQWCNSLCSYTVEDTL